MTLTIDGVTANIEVTKDQKTGSWGFIVEIPSTIRGKKGISGIYTKRTGLTSELDAANRARQEFEFLLKDPHRSNE